MAKAVFISHTSREAELAHALCAELEGRGIFCWIAPRDVPLGHGYGGAIVEAIATCEIMVLIFSDYANQSPQVLREIERAVHHRRDILPFRIAPVAPSRDLEFFISNYQWFDAFPDAPETYLTRFGDSVAGLLKIRREAPPAKTLVPDLPVVLPGPPRPPPRPVPPRRLPVWRRAAAMIGALAFLAAAAIWWVESGGPEHPTDKSGVALKAPADGATLIRPILMLEWEPVAGLDSQGLSFETRIWADGAAPVINRLTRDSCMLDGLEGLVHWQVRPVWHRPGGEAAGAWSPPRVCTYYRDRLSRLLRTRTLHVGIAETDGIFVTDDAGRISGAEIALLRAVADHILRQGAAGPGSEVNLVYHPTVWGDQFFRLLADDNVDLLASGISISAEREKLYGLAFSRHTFEYPQTLIIHEGAATTDAGGKLALQALGVVDHTTNLTLARALADAAGGERLRLYSGSGPYFKMIGDLAAGALDGVLMDQPYAIKYLADFKRRQPASDLTTEDVTARLAPNQRPEEIGFALRHSDTALRGAIDGQLDALEPLKQELIRQYVSRPPSTLPPSSPVVSPVP